MNFADRGDDILELFCRADCFDPLFGDSFEDILFADKGVGPLLWYEAAGAFRGEAAVGVVSHFSCASFSHRFADEIGMRLGNHHDKRHNV